MAVELDPDIFAVASATRDGLGARLLHYREVNEAGEVVVELKPDVWAKHCEEEK